MAITAYANYNTFDVIVPTPNGSGVVIQPGEAVGGTYIGFILSNTLTEVESPPFQKIK
jgi:hypothetical protein